ncbi:hypothetical protein FI667_g9066, partial [Globisporangium splendens]
MVSYSFDPRPASPASSAAATTASSSSAASLGSGFASFTRPPTFAAYPPSTVMLPAPPVVSSVQRPHNQLPSGITHIDYPENCGIRLLPKPTASDSSPGGAGTKSQRETVQTRQIPAVSQSEAAEPSKIPQHAANTTPTVSSLQTNLESFSLKTTSTPAPLRDNEVVFPSQNSTIFRYAFTIEGSKVTIWLENKKTKQQWESDPLTLDEFVASESLIPMATIEDYVPCFEDCLARSRTDPEQKSCDLRQLEHLRDGELQLELQIRIHLFARVLMPKYRFTLCEVELDRIDVLTARVRSQEAELASLRAELNELKARKAVSNNNISSVPRSEPIYFQAETIGSTRSGNMLSWGPANAASWTISPSFNLPNPENIHVLVDGVFVAMLVIKHVSARFRTRTPMFQLYNNGQCVATCTGKNEYGSLSDQTVLSSSFQRVLTLQKHDVLSVLYTGDGEVVAESSVIIFHCEKRGVSHFTIAVHCRKSRGARKSEFENRRIQPLCEFVPVSVAHGRSQRVSNIPINHCCAPNTSLSTTKPQGTALCGVHESSGTVTFRAFQDMTARYRLTLSSIGEIQMFKRCLDEEANHFIQPPYHRCLKKSDDIDELRMVFEIPMQMLSTKFVAVFEFELHSIKLEPVDLMNAKVQDRKEEMVLLLAELEKLKIKLESATENRVQEEEDEDQTDMNYAGDDY